MWLYVSEHTMPDNCLVLFGRDIFSLSAPWKFVFSSVVGFFFFFSIPLIVVVKSFTCTFSFYLCMRFQICTYELHFYFSLYCVTWKLHNLLSVLMWNYVLKIPLTLERENIVLHMKFFPLYGFFIQKVVHKVREQKVLIIHKVIFGIC